MKLWTIHKVTSSKNIICCFCLDQAEGQNETNDFPSNNFVLHWISIVEESSLHGAYQILGESSIEI